MFSSKLLAGSAIILTAAALTIAAASPLSAQDAEEEDNGPGSGVLMLSARGMETATPAIQLGTDMDVTVSGTVARVRVTQAFRNTSTRWMEAPLPLSAAARRRGRQPEDGRRPARHRRPHQARARLRRRSTKRPRPVVSSAGLVEEQRPNLFVQPRRQCRPGRDRADRDRISGAGAPGRRRVLAAPAVGRRPALCAAAHAELAEEDRRRERRHIVAGSRSRAVRTRCRST